MKGKTMSTDLTLPISDYCKAFEAWMDCIQQANKEDPREFPWAEHIPDILLAIHKSALLYRLIYIGQEVRKEKCSVHKGHWCGIPMSHNDCGCGFTGWVPNTYDEETAVNAWCEISADSRKEDWYYREKDWITRSKETWPTKDEAVAAWKEYMK